MPPGLRGAPLNSVESAEMGCESTFAFVAGLVSILLLLVILVTFCAFVGARHFGILPEWAKKYEICSPQDSLPKYTRVNPKPGSRSNIIGPRNNDPTSAGDLEWDDGDIGG